MPRIERSVLGAILIDGRICGQASELQIDDFSLDFHRRIFRRIADLAATEQPIDILTVVKELDRHGELEAVGGVPYVSGLVERVPDRPLIQHYVKMLHDTAGRRRATKLFEKAQRLADDPSVPTAPLSENDNDLSDISDVLDPLPPRFSEEALALRFSRRYADDLRYVSRWGHWMRWDGMRWVDDDTLHVFDLARGISRAASAECGDAEKSTGTRLASKATSAAIERLAAADRRHAATAEQWDTNPWMLNTPTGTVDLRTGETHEHSRAEHITKITAAGPGGDCLLWLQFLDRVTGGDAQLQSFLQCMIGYALTGSTREHALFFLYGTGANGKSVFLSTLCGLLAGYAKTASASSFTASTTEQHPTDLARLRGARFVTAIETEDGARWAESKIKSLTGGDRVAARFMRCDFFEFTPEFKLAIAGNHKPSLRSVDEAIRRRLYLVPFTVTIPEDERDPRLGEKLRAEYPGILAWAIQGCLVWQRHGLNPPPAVRNATADYLDSEDAIGHWLEECCITERESWTAVGTLFANWQTWCERAGESEGSQKRFTRQVEAHGFRRVRTSRAKGFSGIVVRQDVVPGVPHSPVFPVSRAPVWTPYIEESGTSGIESPPTDLQGTR